MLGPTWLMFHLHRSSLVNVMPYLVNASFTLRLTGNILWRTTTRHQSQYVTTLVARQLVNLLLMIGRC